MCSVKLLSTYFAFNNRMFSASASSSNILLFIFYKYISILIAINLAKAGGTKCETSFEKSMQIYIK